jgi:excisionase family DNA binding protein
MNAAEKLAGAPPATMTVDEVARELRVDRKTVYAMVQRDEIPGAFHAGRLLRFRRAVVVRWLSEGEDSPRKRRVR